MYAVYHGPSGLTGIASSVHSKAARIASSLRGSTHVVKNQTFFDTLEVTVDGGATAFMDKAVANRINVRYLDSQTVGLSFDEVTSEKTLETLAELFGVELAAAGKSGIPDSMARTTDFLTHPVFNVHRSETDCCATCASWPDKDIALDRAMIPLGSCTMKLNATAELKPVVGLSSPTCIRSHRRTRRLATKIIPHLEEWLSTITGYAAFTLQPNAGSQGEFAGLLAIRAYHESRGDVSATCASFPPRLTAPILLQR